MAACDFCLDDGNRPYHLDQLADREGSSDLLLRCPRCATLWELASHGRDDRTLSVEEARARYPGARLSG